MNREEFCRLIDRFALKSLIYEVTATPKPGLVDRKNSGSHKDMDFYTFIDSSISLTGYFYKCAHFGTEFDNDDKRELLKAIRPIGIKAEEDMFKATKGVNTHKGLIFSLGIIAAAAGYLYSKESKIQFTPEEITTLIKEICKGLTLELENLGSKKELTYGEKLYIKYGSKGIRGEVESGFETVRKYSLPLLKELKSQDVRLNDSLIQVLLSLMANADDSNILGRHNMDVLEFVKVDARTVLNIGGYLSANGRDYVEEMDNYFIQKNISPGGSADLLAVTIMLYLLQMGDI